MYSPMKLNIQHISKRISSFNRLFSSNPSSIPITFTQRALLTPYFAIGALSYPNRGDFVAGLADTTSTPYLRRLKSHLLGTEKGRRLLQEKPLINSNQINLDTLKHMDNNSFGYKYYEFLESHNYSPDDRTPVRFMDDPDLIYIMTRYRQVHDFWHVLCDLPVSILGELGLKRLEWYLTGFPLGLLSSTAGQLRLSLQERLYLRNILFPWALRCALNSKDMLAFRYEQHFETSIDEVRDMLHIEKAPKVS